MVQFYVLAVFFNLLGGLALCLEGLEKRGPAFEGLRAFLGDPTVRLILGILTAVTGAFKLLTVMRGDIPVVGDFLPAASAIVVGLTLLLEAYRRPGASSASRRGRAADFLLGRKSAVGLAGIISGLVHFLFPMVLFL